MNESKLTMQKTIIIATIIIAVTIIFYALCNRFEVNDKYIYDKLTGNVELAYKNATSK